MALSSLSILALSVYQIVVVSSVVFSSVPSEDYFKMVADGLCQVNCLNQSQGVLPPALDEENEVFTKSVTCTEPSCQNCFQTLSCGDRCCQIVRSGSIQPEPLLVLRPIFHCSTFLPENSSFDAYFKLEFQTLPGQNASAIFRTQPYDIPWMFIVAMEVETDQKWQLGPMGRPVLTPSWFPNVNVPANTTFRLRVTPIAPNGVYAAVYSEVMILKATPERGVLRKPRNVTVRRIRQNPSVNTHPDLQVLLHWESGMGRDATCAGRIWILDNDSDFCEYNHANETFWFNFTNQTKGSCLSFGKNYSIHIMEISDVNHDTSNATEISFRLPPCLQFFDNNFTMCPPPPPRGLRFNVTPTNDILATWLPPEHTSATNQIEAYELRLIKFNSHYSSKTSTMPAAVLHHPTQLANVTVGGATTSVLFRNVTNSGLVQVLIRAYSKGGVSPVIFEGPQQITTLHYSDSVAEKFLVAGLVFAFLTIFITLAFMLKIRKEKQERRRVRAKYFGDDKDISEALECSYFPTYCSKWLIDTSCLKIGELIGEGNFGQVHAATLYKSQSTRIVAVKTLKDGVNLGEKSRFWEEFQILKNLEPHPNLVRLIGIVRAHYPTLVVEYCDGGDLHSYLKHLREVKVRRLGREKRRLKWMRSGTISGEFLRNSASLAAIDLDRYSTTAPAQSLNLSAVTNEAYFYSGGDNLESCAAGTQDPVEFNLFVSFARQIAVGMEFLANNKIVHRDLAARNILVMHESKPVLKIADFGLSRDVYEKNWYKKNSDDKIPFKWLALECLLDEVYTTKSDVWSYGVLLWEIVTYGGSPYPGIKNVEIFEFLKKGFRMSQPDGCPPELYVLMRKCWEKESDDRPDFATLRRLLDAMMEKSEGVDYFQLLDSHGSLPGQGHRQSQASTDDTIEADVKYSTLAPIISTFEDCQNKDTDSSDTIHQSMGVTENLLYASILDSSSQEERPCSTSYSKIFTSAFDPPESYISSQCNEASYENRFSVNRNEMNYKSRELPFEFEIISKELSPGIPGRESQTSFLNQNYPNQGKICYSTLIGQKSNITPPAAFV